MDDVHTRTVAVSSNRHLSRRSLRHIAYKLKPHTATVTSAIVPRLSYSKASIDNSMCVTEWILV